MPALPWVLGAVALLILVAPAALAWFVSGFLVHRPDELPPGVVPTGWESADPRSLYGLDYTNVEFSSSDGIDVRAWLVPGSPGEGPKSAVVFAHGRGGSRRLVLGILHDLHVAGLSVLSFDARGHGETEEATPGAAFVSGWLDVAAAVEFLREERGFERVGVFGVSQGAASATMAVGRSGSGVDALVAQSGATSLFGLIRGLEVLGWVPDWGISLVCRIALSRMRAPALSPRSGPIDDIGQIAPTPLLIVHGEADDLVSVEEARALFEAAGEPKELWTIPGLGHVDLAEHPDYTRRIVAFLSEHLR